MRPRRGRLLAAVVAAVVLSALVLLAGSLLQPQRLARLVLDAVGGAAGLEITFEGDARYRLRGTPLLEVRDIVVRRPGDTEPMLRAVRALVSVPWSTVRARGAPVVIERIELDAPVLHVAPLLAWLEARPPGTGTFPTLRDGVQVRDGRVIGGEWEIRSLDLRVPHLSADAAASASARGSLVLQAPALVRFDLQIAATRPSVGAGVALRGPVRVEFDGSGVTAFVTASGAPQRRDDGTWRVPRLRAGASGAFTGDGEPLRFALGVQTPVRVGGGTWTLAPMGFALRGDGRKVPSVSGQGHAALDQDLAIALEGDMPEWPVGWPPLPAPLDTPQPTRVALRYLGPADLSTAPLGLRMARGGAVADASGRMPDLLAWLDGASDDTPLPPLGAAARVSRVEVAGAVIEGLDIRLEPGPEEPR